MLVAANALTKIYPGPAEDVIVFSELNLQVADGESVAVVGPSGSGKTTLLSILGAMEAPTSGEVRIDGEDPYALTQNKLAQLRAEKIGFVFQEHHLLPHCTALENVLLPVLADGRASQIDQKRAAELLGAVDLAEREKHLPSQLSGGERQRVAIARALMRKPVLLLADEPTGNLDRQNATRVTELLLLAAKQQGAAVVVATHDEKVAQKMETLRKM